MKKKRACSTEPPTVTPEIERVFGDAIDLFGTGGGPPKGVTEVATTFEAPGVIRYAGCPIHGVGCPPHCPVLKQAQAFEDEERRARRPKRLPLILACLALWGCGGAPFTEAPGVDALTVQGDEAGAEADARALPTGDAPGAHLDAGAEARAEDGDGGLEASQAPDAPSGQDAPVARDAPPAEASSEACAPVTHTDGLGQSWTDCTPAGTYTLAEASAACLAGYGSALACASHICGSGQPSDPAFHAVCGSLVCWAYDGPYVGKVTLPASGGCPSSGAMMADWR